MIRKIHQSHFTGFIVLCGVFIFYGQNAVANRNPSYATDRFGYELVENIDCQYQWIDLSSQTTALELQAGGSEPANDEGGALVALNQTFEFYTRPYQEIVVSSNGYISFNSSLSAENGADFSNDCILPAVPDNDALKLGRIAVLHDDLQAGADAGIYARYFNTCPRQGPVLEEACTIVQWQHWDYHRTPGADLNFEVVLYHSSRAMAFQYQDHLNIDTQSATLGMQAASLRSAVNVGCGREQVIPAHGAWCVYYPQSPEVFLSSGFEIGIE